jgi:hypothetical protein
MRKVASWILACSVALPAAAAPAAVEVELQVAGRSLALRGAGECKDAPQASIYGMRAGLTTIAQRTGDQSARLALWQPANGSPAMFQLDVARGSSRHTVDTVKAGSKMETRGSGKASLTRSGAGGVVTIEATTAGGERITGTLRCAAFGKLQAEGG